MDYKQQIRSMEVLDAVVVQYPNQNTVRDFVYKENKRNQRDGKDFFLRYKKLDYETAMVSKVRTSPQS